MAQVHWTLKPDPFFPDATVPGNLVNLHSGVVSRMLRVRKCACH
jgi:hypothetical protein